MLLNRFMDHTEKIAIRLLFIISLMPLISLSQPAPLSVPFEHHDHRFREQRLRTQGHILKHTVVKPELLSKRQFTQCYRDTINSERSWLYRKLFHEHLLSEKGENWSVQADPLFDFSLGREWHGRKTTWLNTRGFQLQGNIGKNIAFYTSLYENQAFVPEFIDRFIETWTIMPVVPGVGIMPGQGIVKEFNQKGAWDYANATGYFSWSPSSLLNFQFGHDRHFIGSGYRSLLLSDISFPYPYFRMQIELGPFQYTYWLMQHIDPGAQPLSFHLHFRRKYAALGFLNVHITDRLQAGLFQALSWPGDDTIGGSRPPSWQYMNPAVFLHPVHYASGSEGNLLLGANFQWEPVKNYFIYGQFLLDELRVREFIRQTGHASNKFGGQLGFKAFDFAGINQLFLQAEYNAVRPYTYSHINRMSNYAHYLQPLAHPSGANFREFLLIADYRFDDRWFLNGKFIYNIAGADTNGINFGSNIFLSYFEAPGGIDATGIRTGQGLRTVLLHSEFAAGYMLNPKTNMRLEIRYILRSQGPDGGKLPTNWLQIGFRTALRNLYYDF